MSGVLCHGATDVKIAVVSMSARSTEGNDADYLAWHLLDHLPEQYRIRGLRCGTRWVSTPACRAARAAGDDRYDAVDHVVAYLFAEPLDVSLDTFFALGADLREAGRMPLRLPSIELGGYDLASRIASPRALVGADVLPWRPARGIYLLLEEGPPVDHEALVGVPGVAGVWSFEGTDLLHSRLAPTSGRSLSICYLDDDPVATSQRLAGPLQERWADGTVRPLLAAPLVAVTPWAWGAALPG
ncbi:MAG: hypothetical protein ACOYXM_14525 [Actinomycetota bacterium]